MKSSILIVDDHPMMRTALRIAVENEKDLQLVGEAGTRAEAERMAAVLKPDLVLLDLYLPDGSIVDFIHFRNDRLPQTRILVITSSNNEADIIAAVQAGADSYAVKDISADQLIQAIRSVLAGENFLTPSTAGILMHYMRKPLHSELPAAVDLSLREIEILKCLSKGQTNAEICTTLCITESTVRTHLQRIIRKLRVNNRAQVVVYAVKRFSP